VTISKEMLIEMYKTMLKIRHFENNTWDLYTRGIMQGLCHLYVGEEAVATGACMALNKDDYITSTHRGHGHVIAKGADLKKMVAELLGKETGYCKGKGGSMHIADVSLGILGANGIVGGGFGIATGAGLSAKMRGTKQVAICFFGDGAAQQGIFHESVNLASIWKLPVVYLCENNLYALTNPQKNNQNIKNLADRADSYGIPGVIADGMDVVDVYMKVSEAVNRARNGEGPTLIEAKTYRYKGHYVGDPVEYIPQKEYDYWIEKCPIKQFKKKLISENILTEKESDLMEKEIGDEIKVATDYAKSCSLPSTDQLYEDVFTVNN